MNRSTFVRALKSNVHFSEIERDRVIQKSIEKDSWRLKCVMAMEEFAELQQQISKRIRGYGDDVGLLEEMADVYISLHILESIFNVRTEDLEKAIDVKIEREKKRCNLP